MMLTQDELESALRREGVRHTVLSVMEQSTAALAQLRSRLTEIKDNQEQQRFIARELAFLGDAFEQAGEFYLGPVGLAAIWSKAKELSMDNYSTYALAKMLSTSYGIVGRPDLAGLSRYWLQEHKLPGTLANDKSGLQYVRQRLGHIKESIGELEQCAWGTRDPIGLARDLVKRMDAGDKEAERQYNEIVARQGRYPLVERISENFGNAMPPLRMAIDRALSNPL